MLLIVFRTFVATMIPIALALTAVGTAFLLLFILAGLTDINTITPLLVSMIGLGVGIDYSLFIVTRFRQALHEGLSPRTPPPRPAPPPGRAVLFAGVTVAISVTGLAFFGLDFVTKLGIGSALGVLTTVLIANSLLIAVLAKLGHKIDRLKVPFLRPIDDSEAAREKTLIARWGRFVTAHARAVFVVVLLVLLALASTSLLVRLGASDQGTQPEEQTARRAYDLLAEGFGAGFNGPIPIVVDVNDDPEAPQRIYDGVQGLEGVASVGEPQFNDEETVAIVFVTPDSAPQDEATDELVDRLRDDVVPAATEGGDAVAYVSGLTAAFKDIADRIMERLPLFLLYIIGVTFIVLAMAFRSIVISLTAAITTILSAFVGVRRAHAGGAGGLPARADRPRPDRPDRDVRAADRLRDPLRALDGLHGLPDEPHPGGARPRPQHARGGRARHRGHRPGGRRGGDHHGHGLRGLHPHRRPHLEGVRPPARGRDPHRRAHRADDARARRSSRSWARSRGTSRAGSTACSRTSRSSRRTTARRRAGSSRAPGRAGRPTLRSRAAELELRRPAALRRARPQGVETAHRRNYALSRCCGEGKPVSGSESPRPARAPRTRAAIRVARNVVLLGLTSLFTDISSEMVATILPLYLVYTLGFTPLQFGVVDGLYQGAAALVRVAGGFVADR